MQQAEETGTETEAQSLRGLGLVEERGVVEPELLERVLELRIVLGVRRIEAREDHRLRRTVARQRLRGGSRRERERISDAAIGHRFQPGRDVTHLAGDETLDRARVRNEYAELQQVALTLRGHQADPVASGERAVHHADVRDDAFVRVVVRVEDERAQRGVRIPRRRGDALDDRVEELLHARAGLPRGEQDLVLAEAERRAELLAHDVEVDVRKVDLIDDGYDLEALLHGEICVRERLGLDPLRRVDEQHCAFACRERAAHLVREVNVTRRVDQIQLVISPGHPDRTRLDRDPVLALQLHRVEELLAHLPERHGAGRFEKPVGERRLAVIDMRDHAKVADAHEVGHGKTG